MDDVETLSRAADRFDELAEAADLMGDDSGSLRLRQQAERARLDALALLDEPSPRDRSDPQ